MRTSHSIALKASLIALALVAGPPAARAADLSTSGVNATMTVNSWGSGYCANVTLANTSTAAVTSWALVVALAQSTPTNVWGATSSVSGSLMTLRPVDYTTRIAPGTSANPGFCANATGGSSTPALSSLEVVGGGSGGPTTYALDVGKAGAGTGAVTSSPAGVACGSTCTATYASGTTVTLSATAASGSTFAGWGGACVGTGTCSVTMTAARTVTATFDQSGGTNYALSVARAGTGSGTVTSTPAGIACGATCTASYASGTTVTLAATAAAGSTFTSWGGACAGTGACIASMTTARAITATFTASAPPTTSRPRIIVMTDGEVDDRSSMVRFLMYASDFDVKGIVQVNSRFQKSGHSKEKWLEEELTRYETVLPNLRVHDPNYPSGAYLRSVSKVGNENSNDLYVAPPSMATRDTPGSQLIIDTLLDGDPRPVHLACWGGCNTAAYALWKLKTSYTPAQFAYAASRARIYAIWYQDGGGQWIEDNVKEAYINEAYKWDEVWDYGSVSGSVNPSDVKAYMTSAWLTANVKTGHGPLGAYTPQSYVSEGDTPSFLHLVDNGLLAHLDYTLGGWGGRSRHDDPAGKPNHVTDQSGVADDGNANKPYWRWVIDAQNDFAARMDYCVASSYGGANHPPVANVVGDLVRSVAAGTTVTLDGSPSVDPDGNALSYLWWQYHDADSAAAKVTIANATARSGASFVVPNEPGKQVHVILEVKDNGTPALKGYRRIIFKLQ